MLLSEDHQAVQDAVRSYVQAEIAPHAAAWDKSHTFPAAALQGLAALGCYGVAVPAEWASLLACCRGAILGYSGVVAAPRRFRMEGSAMTESMTSGWYYGREGSPTGPLSWEELRAAGASGAFGPADLVWHEGYADWVPAAQIPGLLGVTASTGPAPGRRPWLLPVVVSVIGVLVGVGLGLYFGLSRGGDSDPAGVVRTTDSVVVGGGTTVWEATTSTTTSATAAGTAPSSVPSTSAVAPGLTVVDQASLAVLDLGQFHELVRGASGRLVDRLGGDEAGFCAVLIALDQGHDTHQILTGALNDRLEADGIIRLATLDLC